MEKLLKITYCGQDVKVNEGIANFLITDAKRQQAQERQDRRRLSKKDLYKIEEQGLYSTEKSFVEDEVITAIDYELLEYAMSELTETQQIRCKLYYFHGRTYQEIANIEGVHFTAVSKSIDRAMKQIKKVLIPPSKKCL